MSATPSIRALGASRSTRMIAKPPTTSAIDTTSALPSSASTCLCSARPMTTAGMNATRMLRTKRTDVGSRRASPISTAQKVRQYSTTIAAIAPSWITTLNTAQCWAS